MGLSRQETLPSSRAQLGALFRLAIAAGIPTAVDLQLRRGAPLDGRDTTGRSPLMLAASRGHLELCRFLILRGADCSLTDDAGRDAAGIAESRGHGGIAALVREELACRVDEAGSVAQSPLLPAMQPDNPVNRASSPVSCFATTGLENRQHEQPSVEEDAPVVAAPLPEVEPPACLEADGVPFSDATHPDARLAPIGIPSVAVAAEQQPEAGSVEQPADDGWSSWNDGWEPETDLQLSRGDDRIGIAATIIDSRLANYHAIVDDTDWSDVEINLPYPGRRWARKFDSQFDALPQLEKLILGGMQEGRVPLLDVDTFLSHTNSGLPDETLSRNLLAALEEIGVLVDDDSPFPSAELLQNVSSGNASYCRSIIQEILELLDGLASDTAADTSLIDVEARRFPSPSADEQERMFLLHQAALDAIIRIVAPHPAVIGVVTGWIQGLESGRLAPSDLTRNGEEISEQDEDQEVPSSGLSRMELLLQSLRRISEVKAPDRKGGHEALAETLIALSLMPARIVELAERIDPVMTSSLTANNIQDRHQLACAVGDYYRLRDVILKMNLRVVIWHGRRYMNGPLPLADLVQEGLIGLLRAIEKFDPDRGSRFGTYAIWWVRQAMTRFLADAGQTIRVPVHVHESRNRVRKTNEWLRSRLGRQPDINELAKAVGQPVDVVQRLAQAEVEMLPLEKVLIQEVEDPCDETGFAEASVYMVEPGLSPLDAVLLADLRRCLLHGLKRLDPREQRILVLRFGLDTSIPLTLEEVGQIYGVTRERIRQIEAKAFKRLKRFLPSKNFDTMCP